MLFAPALAALVINVSTPADMSPTLVDRVIAEADAIWRPAGLTFSWRRQPSADTPWLDVVIGAGRGSAHPGDADEPLGWIRFDGAVPKSQVYVSYANACDLLESSAGVVGAVSRMPLLERETYLSRAMGRALAHEIGHYLFASKTHAPAGLMKARHSAWEFFTPERRRFDLSPDERARALVDSRLARTTAVAAAPPA